MHPLELADPVILPEVADITAANMASFFLILITTATVFMICFSISHLLSQSRFKVTSIILYIACIGSIFISITLFQAANDGFAHEKEWPEKVSQLMNHEVSAEMIETVDLQSMVRNNEVAKDITIGDALYRLDGRVFQRVGTEQDRKVLAALDSYRDASEAERAQIRDGLQEIDDTPALQSE